MPGDWEVSAVVPQRGVHVIVPTPVSLLIVASVVEHTADLDQFRAAAPGAQPIVCLLDNDGLAARLTR